MKRVTLWFFFAFASCMVMAEQPRLLVIDTGFNDPYTYRNFLLLAQSVGFDAQVVPFYSLNEDQLKEYSCILFNIDGFLAHDYYVNKKNNTALSPITKRCLSLLSSLKKKKHCVCGIMMPNRIGPTLQSSLESAYALCTHFFTIERVVKKSLSRFLSDLFQSDSKRSVGYHTSLLTKSDSVDTKSALKPKTVLANCVNEKTNTLLCAHLPYSTFRTSPPIAWYCVHPRTHERFFVTKASLMLFSDIGENFIYNPLDFSLRTRKLEELQHVLYELFCITTCGKLTKNHNRKKLILPEIFSKRAMQSYKSKYSALRSQRADPLLYKWLKNDGIWCSFGEIAPYTNKSALSNLLATNLNLWWLECYPEWYLARDALKKSEKNDFLNTLNKITLNFKELLQSHKGNKPHIFLGTGLTSNFAKKKVDNPAIDAYGRVYSKVPSPFDTVHFWKEELFDVFEALVKEWPNIGNSVPIAGVFLDLEMYHAQDQTGHYLATMDFSDLAWDIYCSNVADNDAKKCTTTKERVRYLLANHAFDTYFSILHKEAYALGLAFKKYIEHLLPQAIIAVYDIHLPHNWFYKGLLAGLSSPERPIILATFNLDFYNHMEWLVKNRIYMYHLPALLLSKFKNQEDLSLIDELIPFHDGIWFNRISRLEESRDPRTWSWDYGLEVTPLPTDVFVSALRKKIYEVQKHYYLR